MLPMSHEEHFTRRSSSLILHFSALLWALVIIYCGSSNGGLAAASSGLPGSCKPAERTALLSFKAGIREDPSQLLQGWLPDTDCCGTNWGGVVCNDEGHVVTLDLRPDPAFDDGVYLTGSMSHSLASLTYLSYLDLSDLRNLSGVLPPELGNLKYLEHFDVRNNKLSGVIPSSYGSLKNLNWLSLGGNFLNGSIPASLGELGPKLNYLYLAQGSLTGPIPESIFQLPNLTYLYLGFNKLSGGIPSVDLSTLGATLQYLDLSTNELSGELPLNIGEQLKHLYLLDMSFNRFSGSIPASIGLISGLGNFALNNNRFSGNIPASLAGLKNLVYVNLASNRLTGPIPQGAPFSTIGIFDHNRGLCGSPLPPCKMKRLM